MSILIDNVKNAVYEDGHIYIYMKSGLEIKFPVIKNHILAKGTERQLNNIEISPYGIHWPDLDEDLSFYGLLNGDYGQYSNVHKIHRDVN